MRILYVGDVMAAMGMEAVERRLPQLRSDEAVDLVIAQAENVSDGRGITPADFARLQQAGVDFCSGGNHSFDDELIFPALNDPAQPIIRPANYPEGTAGLGYKYIETVFGKVLVISLLGQIVGKDAGVPVDNPLRVIDAILKAEQMTSRAATIVNFHGDYSSEKVIIGHYLDSRVTAVIGDHWHVPTADARVLPGGSAHITDVGMCGALDSSLGVTYDSVLPRWRDGKVTRNVLATEGRHQFNAALLEVNEAGLAKSIKHIRHVW